MIPELNGEKLTAYVLGELDEAEQAAVEAALESNAEARLRVEELRQSARLLAEAFEREPSLALNTPQREAIMRHAEEGARGVRKWLRRVIGALRMPPRRLAPAVASIAVVVVLSYMLMPDAYREAARRSPPTADVMASAAQRHHIAEMRGGRMGGGRGGFVGGGFGGGGFGGFGGGGGGFGGHVPTGSTGLDPMEPAMGKSFYAGRGKAKGVANLVVIYDDHGALREDLAQADVPAPAAPASTDEMARPDLYLIKNASLVVEVEDSRQSSERLVAMAQAIGGYVSSLNESVDGFGRRSVFLVLRVPADQLDAALVQFEPLGTVLNKHVSTQDVTEEFVDSQSRVRNLKRAEERLLTHLDRSGELEDIVLIEKELTEKREQIERLEGRLRYLGNRVAYSTVQVTLQEKPGPEPMAPPASFSSAKVFSEAVRALVVKAQGLWSRVIWIVVWTPVWLPLALMALVVYRVMRRRLRRNEA